MASPSRRRAGASIADGRALTRFQSAPFGTRRSHYFRISLAVLLGSGTAGEAMTTGYEHLPPEIYLSVDVSATGLTVCLLPRANLGWE
jgi:hypothetical protein